MAIVGENADNPAQAMKRPTAGPEVVVEDANRGKRWIL